VTGDRAAPNSNHIAGGTRSKIDKGFAQDLLHTVRGAGFVIRQNK
jgi:hypothetical protein